MLHTPINRPWNFRSGVNHCDTCEGTGKVAASRRPSTWDPYPEADCPDCAGEHAASCEVCGSEIHAAGYDCIVCQMVDELPTHALSDGDHITRAIKSAMGARLLSLSDRRAA